jgi:hypothetical protein
VVDITRLREGFGWEPARSSRQVLEDYARGRSGELAPAPVGENGAAPGAEVRPRLIEGLRGR